MEKLLTAKQISELLEVSVSAVYDWVSRRQIPYVKLGRLIRFKKNEIFRWVDTRTIKPKERPPKREAQGRPSSLQKEFPLA